MITNRNPRFSSFFLDNTIDIKIIVFLEVLGEDGFLAAVSLPIAVTFPCPLVHPLPKEVSAARFIVLIVWVANHVGAVSNTVWVPIPITV